ncbi:gliding motility-associated C-terminal domain-containing protein [Cytophaga hutchinsonii]|nr:gliding motility-associated C-terminal domain-containing protein [Cytophaga hutchinsonii]
MKKNTLGLKIIIQLVIVFLSIHTNAQILVSGTDFDPSPGNASRFYIGLDDITQIGFQNGSITSTPPLATNVNPNIFNVGYLYAVTPTPIRLDSTRYQNFIPVDYSYVYAPPASSGGNLNILQYSLTGLVPNSSVSVIVDYCSAVKSTYASCTGQRNEFKAGINLDASNQLFGNDVTQIGMGECRSATITGTVDAGGNMVFRMNNTRFGSCQAMAIKKIAIMGFPQPAIISTSGTEVCAGEQITVQTTSTYNATYQWQVDNGSGTFTSIAGATNQALLYEVGTTPATYKFRCLVTPLPSGTAIASNVVQIKSITCCLDPVTGAGTSRKTIYYDDFGTLDLSDATGRTYKVWDYTDITNPKLVTKTTTTPFRWTLTPAPLGATFKATGPLQDGEYAVASYLTATAADGAYAGAQLDWANRVTGPTTPPNVSLDHSGTKAGGALFINCPPNTQGQKLYTRTIPDLCFGKQLYFECWIAVFTNGPAGGCPSYSPVDVTIKLTDGSNTANTSSANATATRQSDGGGVWVRVAGNITLGAGSTSVIMDVINNSNQYLCGNDLVIDDIKIMACAPPPLDVYFDIPTISTKKDVCTAALDLNSKPSTLLKAYYNNAPKYLYQWTKTPADYTSWKNLAVPPQSGEVFTIANPSLNAAYTGTVNGDKIYFRVIAATDAVFTSNNNFTAPKYANDNDPCKNYSVSNIIESTVKCPSCTKPSAVTITTPSTGTVTLCQGTAQNLIGRATVTAAAQNTNFTYSWIKVLPTPVTTPVAATVIALPANTPTSTPAFALTGALADAGTYTLRVEDGSAGNAACYTEASVVVVVDPVVTAATISTAQTICSGTAPAQMGGAVAAGGSTTATASYVWESSANGTSGWTTVSGATLKDYTPGTLTADTYYRRTDKKGACTGVASNVIKITVDPVVTAATISTAQTICSGTAPAQIGGAVAAGGSTTATASYVWESSANGTSGWTTVSGAALKDYTPGTLTADTYYRRTDKKGVCTGVASNVIKITVDPVVTAATISTAQTICSGTAPAQIGGAVAAGGSTTATASYVWESSANGTSGWTTVSGAALKDYTPGTLTATTYYRRTDTKGVCPAAVSNVIQITVDPVVTAATISTAQTICSGTAPAQIGGAVAAGGSTTATASYVWESSANGTSGWTTVSGATLKDYTPGTLTADTYYRRTDKKGACTGVASNVIKITVDPVVTAATISTAQTICSGTAPAQIGGAVAAGGSTTATASYVWESSANGTSGWTTVSGAALKDYTPGTLTADTYYRRTDKKGVCTGVASNVIKITVDPVVTAATISTAQTICSGTAPAQIGGAVAAGGSTTATASYVWESSANGTSGWTTVSGAALKDYTPGTLTATTYYRRTDTKGVCPAAVSNVIQITVDPVVTAAVISSDQSICSGAAPSQIGGAAAAGGSTTATAGYVWEVSTTSASAGFSAISGATLKDYTPGTLTVDTWYRRVDKKGTCAGVASNAVKISIVAVAPATVSLSRLPSGPICEGTNVTFTASVGNGGTPAYVWTSSVTGALASTTDTYSSTTLVDGEVITVDITSSLSCANPKTATASSTMVVNTKVTPTISITADKTTICPSESVTFSITAQTNQGTAPAGPTYQWQTNKSGTYQNISGATNSTYIASSVTNGESFRVVMTTGLTCVTSATAVSTPVAVTVTPVPTLSVSIAADKATICSGNAVQFTATATGSGSTPAPTYEWFIGAAGSETSQGAGSTTANPYSTTSLTTTAALSPQTYSIYVRATSNATCASTTPAQSAAVTVTVNAGVGAGTITTTLLTICNNTVPGAITEASAASGGTSPTYTWEESIDNGAWGPATGTVSGTGFTPSGAKTGTKVSYRRIVTYTSIPAPCNTAMSNIIDITVNPALVAGVIQDDQIICSGLVPAALTQVSAPTGGTGSYTYQWQSSTTGTAGSFSNIGGATTSGYAPGALTATTYYQRVETSGTCGSVTGNMVTITVSTPEVVTAQINDPGQVCEGSVPMVFTATTTGSGTLTYAWTLDGAPVGTNSSTYSYNPTTASDAGKKVKVVVTTSIGCNAGPGISNEVALNIVVSSMPSVSITGAPAVQCSGLPVRFTVSNTTAGGNNPTYQWFIESQAGVATAVSGATNTSFTSTGLTAGDKVYVELTSNLGCALGTNPHASNKIAPAILATPAPVINETPLPICSPEGFEFTAVVGSATPPNTLQWYKDGVAISGATTSIYKAFESGLYSIEESNAACGTISTEVPLTVIQTPVANAGSDITVKEGEQVTLNGSGGVIYSWSPDTGLDDASSATPKLTADKTIMYILTVRDATGQCHDDDEVMVFVERPIKVPNVITVNGDGVNDTWEIENIESFPNAEFLIYNRWGNLVWKSTGYPKEWDATNFRNGEVLPDGTYFYIIDLHSTIYTEAYTGYIQVVK